MWRPGKFWFREPFGRRGKALRLLLLGGMATLLSGCAVGVVDTGFVGVWKVLGKIKMEETGDGFVGFYIPAIQELIRIPVYNVALHFTSDRETEGREEPIDVLTKDGLPIVVEMTVVYRVVPDSAAELYVQFNGDWETNFLRPTIRSAVRNVASQFRAVDFYQQRKEVESAIDQEIRQAVADRTGKIEILDVRVRELRLPPDFVRAIEAKLVAQQEAEKMQFVLEKERQEKERKIIEAEGIAQAQQIIRASLSREYLQWYYIERLKDIIASKNNTVIIMPFDQNLIPMIQVPGGPR